MGDTIITLIWPTKEGMYEDTIIFGTTDSIGHDEFFDAAQTGLKPALKATVWGSEYEGQPIAVVYGKRYSIYRTYYRKDQKVELYLSEKIGVR